MNGFSCVVKFEQEDDQQEYSIYLNPGFTPLKVKESTCYSIESLNVIDYTMQTGLSCDSQDRSTMTESLTPLYL